MKLEIIYSNQFKKDVKLANRRGLKIDLLIDVLNTLANGETLDGKYKDHNLSGNYSGFRECHIQPDWLLVYRINEKDLILLAFRTGTHSDLF